MMGLRWLVAATLAAAVAARHRAHGVQRPAHETLWRVRAGAFFFEETADLGGALVRAARTNATKIQAIPPLAAGADVGIGAWYVETLAAEAVDAFLTTRLEWELQREPFDGHAPFVGLAFDPYYAELGREWRKHQFGPNACDAVVLPGQLASLGATLGKIGHVGLDAVRRGFTLQTPMSTDKWYMAQRSEAFCGDKRRHFECFFLPWNSCGTRVTLEALSRSPGSKAVAERMLGPANTYSGRGAVFGANAGASADAFLCDKNTPRYRECPPHENRDGHFVLEASAPDERWDSERRLTLFHRALWHRPAYRLRNLTASIEAAFYARSPDFAKAAATGSCAFAHIRHGDKLYDRWIRIHKTRSFAVDLPSYVSEALPMLELLGAKKPYQILLATDDGDMVDDATAVAPAAAVVAAPASLNAVSSHCRKADQTTMLVSARRTECAARKSGDWNRGHEEFARILATLKIAARCDAVVHNYESSFVQLLWRDSCARRGPRGCQLSFSFGNREAATAADTNRRLNRTCELPPTDEAIRQEFGQAHRRCDPPSPPVPGPTHWSDAAAAFFGDLERRAAAQPP